MLNVIREYRDYSVLGHMDLIVRYDEKGEYPFEKVKPIISEILTCFGSGNQTIVLSAVQMAPHSSRCVYDIFSGFLAGLGGTEELPVDFNE